MTKRRTTCPVCRRKAEARAPDDPRTRGRIIDCFKCGTLQLDSTAEASFRSQLKTVQERNHASSICRRVSAILFLNLLSIDQLLARAILQRSHDPTTVSSDALLEYLRQSKLRRRSVPPLHIEAIGSFLGTESPRETQTLLSELVAQEQLTSERLPGSRYILEVGSAADFGEPSQIKAKNQAPKPIGFAPIYVRELSLTNIKCFSTTQIFDFSSKGGRISRWNVLMGENAVGKTTVLQAIAALFPHPEATSRERDRNVPRDLLNGFARDREGPAEVAIRFEVGHINMIPSSDIPMYAWANRNPSTSMADMLVRHGTFSYSSHMLSEFTYALPSDEDFGLPSLVIAYGAERGSFPQSRPLSDYNDLSIMNLFVPSLPVRSAEQWILSADYAARFPQNRKIGERRFERVKRAIISILPDVTDIVIEPPTDESPDPVLRFLTKYGKVPFDKLSLGYQSTLAWIVDLVSRMFDAYPHSESPTSEPAVIIIDEIDLHLHPKWQRVIMDHLERIFPKAQFIITTHSPLIVLGIEEANFFVLKRVGNHVCVYKEAESVRGWRVDQLLTSDLFDLETARSKDTESLLKRRTRLMRKAHLSSKDRRQLEWIEAQLGELPTAETAADRKAMDIIRAAAESLKQRHDHL